MLVLIYRKADEERKLEQTLEAISFEEIESQGPGVCPCVHLHDLRFLRLSYSFACSSSSRAKTQAIRAITVDNFIEQTHNPDIPWTPPTEMKVLDLGILGARHRWGVH